PPPPCTLYPFRVWSFRPRDPFFCRGEGPVHENFLPVEQGLFIELVEQGVPDFFQHARGFPLDEPPPASARRGKPLRQVSPAGSAAKHPQNAFETGAIIGSGASSPTRRGLLRNEWSQTLPLCVTQQYFRSSCHHTAPSKSRDNRTHAIAQLYVNRVLKPALGIFDSAIDCTTSVRETVVTRTAIHVPGQSNPSTPKMRVSLRSLSLERTSHSTIVDGAATLAIGHSYGLISGVIEAQSCQPFIG